MIQSGQAKPSEITAVTFTRQAAGELQAHLEQELGGKKAIRGLTVGTFHAICQKLLDARPVLSQREITLELKKLLLETAEKLSPKALQQAISRIKNGIPGADSQVDPELFSLWSRRMSADGSCDLEEERRLLFVGMTRAREELLLSCGGEPSIFEKELPVSVLRQKGQRRPTVTQLSLF